MLTLAAALLRASLGRRVVLANESVQIADQEETDLDEVSWYSGE